MFGIDLGISVGSVSCITTGNKILQHEVIFGDKTEKDNWKRCVSMSQYLSDAVRSQASNPKVTIEPYVAIEEPVMPWQRRNPKSYETLVRLYTMVRARLEKWNFTIYSVHPLTVKRMATLVFGKGKVLLHPYYDELIQYGNYIQKGKLTKKGMILAYKKLHRELPPYNTIAGRETLADSFFIAKAGIEKRRIELGITRS